MSEEAQQVNSFQRIFLVCVFQTTEAKTTEKPTETAVQRRESKDEKMISKKIVVFGSNGGTVSHFSLVQLFLSLTFSL